MSNECQLCRVWRLEDEGNRAVCYTLSDLPKLIEGRSVNYVSPCPVTSCVGAWIQFAPLDIPELFQLIFKEGLNLANEEM